MNEGTNISRLGSHGLHFMTRPEAIPTEKATIVVDMATSATSLGSFFPWYRIPT